MRGAAIALGLACCACTGQGLYTTPRTLGDDRTQWTAAAEGGFTFGEKPRCPPEKFECSSTNVVPPWPGPYVAYRRGAGERFEAAIHTPLGADLKWHVVGPSTFDLGVLLRTTIGPARSREYTEDGRHHLGFHLQAPLLASLTTGPICIVASPGPVTLLDGAGRVSQGLRIGLGIQAVFGRSIAVHPEVSYVDEVAGAAEMSLLMVGLGFAYPNLAGQRE